MLEKLLLDERGKKILQEYITNLTSTYEIQCVVVFGSAAKGGWNYRSDIDLLIVSDDMGSDWYERNLAAQKLSRGKIQSFVVPLDEFRLATQQRRYLIWEALYDGVPIVDNGIFTEAQKLFLEWVKVGYLDKREKGWRIHDSEILESPLIS